MGAQLYKLKTGQVHSIAEPAALPIVPRSLLRRIFNNTKGTDRDTALQQKLVPIAVLPHTTLYASASSQSTNGSEQVIAEINPKDFSDGVRAFWSKDLVWQACNRLRKGQPDFSASWRVSAEQQVFVLLILSTLVLAPCFFSTNSIWLALNLLFSILFFSTIHLRMFALTQVDRRAPFPASLQDEQLPVYSVLVPVFKEVAVLERLLVSLQHLNYPPDKLDIKIILEANDLPMRKTIARLRLPQHFEVLVVPAGAPQTKPRALNYALQSARGSLLTIYDAEDVPEPKQLRMAAAKFAASRPNLACIQAELTFFNANENWLTRQFTVEYASLFTSVLPALANYGLPFPLGGTSNHFRTDALRDAGGWDPFNVTEDADLGFRLARLGYESSVLRSVTYEEANTELRNWMHQRSRWLKGFLQTWLVHMRHPIRLWREIGPSGVWVLQATTIGVFASALLHPIFLSITLYQVWNGIFNRPDTGSIQLALNGLFLAVMVLGAGTAIFSGFAALRSKRISGWWLTLATLPAYWFLMCIAGWMALWQFFWKPFHWNKTRHGLSRFVQVK